ncbi:hypothetical protein [Lysobacter gummosus]
MKKGASARRNREATVNQQRGGFALRASNSRQTAHTPPTVR